MAKAEDFQFNNSVGSKLLLATKNTAIRLAKANIGAIGIIAETKRTIEFDFDDTQTDESARLSGIDKIINITFLATDFVNEFGEDDTTPEIELEIAVISLSAQKRVIKTPILNQKGSIKEIVGQNDYNVSINGVLVGQFGFPTIEDLQRAKPVDTMRDLIEIAEAKISVKIVCDYLNNFGVERLMIESFSFPQNLDNMNLQSFTLTCSSDDNELTII